MTVREEVKPLVGTSAEGSSDEAPQRFRYDIQALRAVAVTLVVLNHLWPTRIPGGYIGVDIFFVISGYLITSHLTRETDSTNRLRLGTFWARRAKRLLPAAFVTLLFSTVATVLWAPQTSWQGAMGQIAAAGTYVLNWLLAATSVNYFSAGNTGSAVTHYWSLSVEEQFYLFWPLLLAAGVVLFPRSRRQRTGFTVSVFAVVFIVSFAWAIYSVKTAPSAAYFETTGRAWEFAAGGLLTFIPRPRGRVWLIPLVWLAWGTIVACGSRLSPDSGVPGWWALLPAAATVFIIWVGDIPNSWAPTGVTSLKPVQFIGGISYSLYLWHWPLIFVAPLILSREPSSLIRVGILLSSVALAFLSTRFIEDPVRFSTSRVLTKPKWTLALTAAGIFVLLAITSLISVQAEVRFAAGSRDLYSESMGSGSCFGAQAVLSGNECPDSHTLKDASSIFSDLNHQIKTVPNGASCVSVQGDSQLRGCGFGAKEGTQSLNVALVGDSHAEVWTAALAKIAVPMGLRVTSFLQSGCPPSLGDDLKYYLATSPTVIDGCRIWRGAAIARIASDPKIDVVITASRDRSYVQAADGSIDTGAGYVRAWTTWLEAGKKVIVVNDVPDHEGTEVLACIAESHARVDPCAIPRAAVARREPLAAAASQIHNANFTYVDFRRVFCDTKRCHSVIGGIPAYVDPDHLSAAFARSFSPQFAELAALHH